MVDESADHRKLHAVLAAAYPDLPELTVQHSLVAAVGRLVDGVRSGQIGEAELAAIAADTNRKLASLPTRETFKQEGVSQSVGSFIPEIAALGTLPTMAPALWSARDKTKGETPLEFLQTHYGPWIDKGLTKAVVRRLDPDLYVRLNNYLSPHNNKKGKKVIPDDLVLPTLPQSRKNWVSGVTRSNDFGLDIEPTFENAKKLEAAAKAIRRGLKNKANDSQER